METQTQITFVGGEQLTVDGDLEQVEAALGAAPGGRVRLPVGLNQHVYVNPDQVIYFRELVDPGLRAV